MSSCKHLNFQVMAEVGRLVEQQEIDAGMEHLVKPIALAIDIKVHCRDCGGLVHFTGLPVGVSKFGATVSADYKEARLHGEMV